MEVLDEVITEGVLADGYEQGTAEGLQEDDDSGAGGHVGDVEHHLDGHEWLLHA